MPQTHGYSLTPRKRITESIGWKLEKTKRIIPITTFSGKNDCKNISFQVITVISRRMI